MAGSAAGQRQADALRDSPLLALRAELEQAGLLTSLDRPHRQVAAAGAFALAGCLCWLAMVPEGAWLWLNAVLTGLLLVPAGFLAHDAGHGAVTRHAATDARIARASWALLTGLSDGWWRAKHHSHHRHTNDPARDEDLYPLLTYSAEAAPHTRGMRRFIARHQALLLPLLLCATRAWFQWLSLRFVLARPAARSRELLPMLVHHALFLGVPMTVLELPKALAWLALSYAVTGLYMGLVFLTNHTGMPLTGDAPEGVAPLRQAAITRNVRCGRLGDWLWGGLNYQIEHHLVPDLPRSALRAAAPRVRAFCERQGVRYYCVGPFTAWLEVLRHCHAVGAPLRGDGSRQSRQWGRSC